MMITIIIIIIIDYPVVYHILVLFYWSCLSCLLPQPHRTPHASPCSWSYPGNNGIGYILHVTSRLLDPTGPVEHATAGGRLVCGILMRLQSHQLGENLDLLLRGALARLSNLPLFVNTPGTTQLDGTWSSSINFYCWLGTYPVRVVFVERMNHCISRPIINQSL